MTFHSITSFGWGDVALLHDKYSKDHMNTSSESTAFWFGYIIKAKEWGGSVPFLRRLGAQNDDDVIVEKSPATKGKRKPTVRFSNVQIGEYELTIGDHPCTNFYPLSLDWSHSVTETFSIEDHIADRVLKLNHSITTQTKREP
jgi:hypothetical protein